MAIVMYCNATDEGAVRDEYWSKQTKQEIWTRTTHVGQVLSLGEHNWYDDSDFYAVIWDDETNEPKNITYASTRGWTYCNGAAVDATPERAEKYQAYLDAIAERNRKLRDELAAKTPARGKLAKTIRNVRGKQSIEANVVGEVFWTGKCAYSGKLRVGFKACDGRKVFIAADAIEIVV